jgi:amino acid transporter
VKKSVSRRIIAPIVITIVVCVWAIGQMITTLFFVSELGFWLSALSIVFPLIFVALMAYVLIERIKEIKSGEEDDLDNY